MSTHAAYVMRRAAVEELIDLRHRELRQGLPRELASFAGDDEPTTLHFGAFDAAGEAVCCVTMLRSEWERASAWQLRGMATAAPLQGTGLGGALVPLAEQAALHQTGPVPIWCNARLRAVPFYERHGYTCVSDIFHIEHAGPHRRMVKLPA